jgi:hypothetical protein
VGSERLVPCFALAQHHTTQGALLVGRRALVPIVVLIAALTASAALARPETAVRRCPNFTLSQVNVKLALQIKLHGVSCARAQRVEKADYRAAARSEVSRLFVYDTAGWRCRNRPVIPNLGVPYIAVACTASRGRSISFQIGGT